MKYIIIKNIDHGAHFDPTAYLTVLPELLDELPRGAREFASLPGHYDFYSSRCVKDLRLHEIRLGPQLLEISFAPNKFKHEEWLKIAYHGLYSFEVRASYAEHWASCGAMSHYQDLGDIRLDEILPAEVGLNHEIALTAGRIVVAARDLSASWIGNK